VLVLVRVVRLMLSCSRFCWVSLDGRFLCMGKVLFLFFGICDEV